MSPRWLSRLQVGVNGALVPWLRFPVPMSFVGPDSSVSMCREIAGAGFRRVLVVTDEPLLRLGLVDAVTDELRRLGTAVEVFAEVQPDPGYGLVLSGITRLEAFGADAILAVGGGSSIDAAKAIMLSHGNACHPQKLTGLWLYAWPRRRGLPLFAIPTTAGTGSEVTIAAVVSDEQAQVKSVIVDPKTVPLMAALDPALMTGLPPAITAPTGMDALTHAVEAYLSTMAYDETDRYARAATGSILRNLPVAYHEGRNLEARERMAVASSMAGLAFTRAGVGYVHAFAHQAGALYHVPHGLANAIILPHVLEFSKPRCVGRLADLARVSGLGDPAASDAALADAFIDRVRALNADMQIPATLQALRREDFGRIIDRAFAEAHGTYGVPRYMSREDAARLLESLLAGP